MKKKRPNPSLFAFKPGPHNTVLNWHNIPGQDLFLYARSFHEAAKALATSFQPDTNHLTDFDACPIVFRYRHALELHLKAMVLGEGSNFLAIKLDPLSIYKTHSVHGLSNPALSIPPAEPPSTVKPMEPPTSSPKRQRWDKESWYDLDL